MSGSEDVKQAGEPLVLIVDDDPTQRLLTRDCLELAGYQVAEADSGEAALDMAHGLKPAMILLDVLLPGIDGFETCRRLREDEATRTLPIITITGRDDEDALKQALEAGADDFMMKPVPWHILPVRVSFVMKNHRLQEDLRQALLDSEAANRAKDNFLATISHELRTPLNAVIGFSELMTMKPFGEIEERYLKFVGHINESGRHLLDVITDLLDSTRISLGATELERQPVEMRNLIRSAITMVKTQAEKQRIVISDHLDGLPANGLVSVDPKAIRQILLNLLSNAIKFSDPDSEIKVLAEIEGPLIRIRVRDRGHGIARDELEQVFDMFAKASDPDRRNIGGIGIGLPLSRSLAELHGGRLDLQSTLGTGTVVTLTLPLIQAEADSIETEEDATYCGAA